MLIVVLEGSKPIAAANLSSIPWETISNGVKNRDKVWVRMARNGLPDSFYILDDDRHPISNGNFLNAHPRLEAGDWIKFDPGRLSITLCRLDLFKGMRAIPPFEMCLPPSQKGRLIESVAAFLTYRRSS